MLCADDAQTEAEIFPENERHAAAMTGADPSRLNSNQPTEPLTARQRDVLELVAQGATNGVIDDRLVISAGTVKSQAPVLRKLNPCNRTRAVSRYLAAS